MNILKKLLIWDFDGVIADTEKLWVCAWNNVLIRERNIKLSNSEKQKLLVGVSDKTRRERLTEYIPNINIDDDFMKKIGKEEFYQGTNFMTAIDGVEKVMANKNFEHCIATGATLEQHRLKMEHFQWIKKYMSEKDFFTADMVEHGKPEPDLFLLAAKTKNYIPKDCIAIGDSINDFIAATAAGMDCIAFTGATGNNTKRYENECQKYGVFAVCNNMNNVNLLLNNWYNQR